MINDQSLCQSGKRRVQTGVFATRFVAGWRNLVGVRAWVSEMVDSETYGAFSAKAAGMEASRRSISLQSDRDGICQTLVTWTYECSGATNHS